MKNYGQIIRTILYAFTMLNTVLTATGHNPLPFSESEAYIYITLAVTVGVFIYGVWKNYPTSEAGRVADKVLHAVKSGATQAQDVLNLLECGATGGGNYNNLPFKGRNRVTQPYTYKASSKSGHGGIDIVGDDDKTVYAVESGKVSTVSKWNGKSKTGTQSYGNLVVVTDSAGKRHFYAHLKSISVSKGQSVSVGTVIGIMGNTGNSFGAHLHYEVRTGGGTATRVNPADYIGLDNKKGTYKEVAKKPAAKPSTKPTTPVKKPAHKGTAHILTCKKLKVRKSATTFSKQVGMYYRGDTFYVVKWKGNWAQLESGNWMCAKKYCKKKF